MSDQRKNEREKNQPEAETLGREQENQGEFRPSYPYGYDWNQPTVNQYGYSPEGGDPQQTYYGGWGWDPYAFTYTYTHPPYAQTSFYPGDGGGMDTSQFRYYYPPTYPPYYPPSYPPYFPPSYPPSYPPYYRQPHYPPYRPPYQPPYRPPYRPDRDRDHDRDRDRDRR
ncbi:hypothetical protein SAMN04488112_12230 [Melghirimyces thermohalophilus]|uniref:Uncharacterized protein n=1 Tax=Melghirimyces thermohalophilus TaxID=1236220 RepID=A0A1G6QK95_9BACL|nr:hypothetical protein [Melghirimyces thermohalophilus]SDC92809.1 hypothetical protein SAMN04488112_12230 [Melghirimyces thermohalophilus]